MDKTVHILNTKCIQHALIPLAILTLYSISFSWFLSRLSPEFEENVTVIFLNRTWKLSLLLNTVAFLIFFIFFKLKKLKKLNFENRIEKLYAGDFILIFLPLTPIVQYILNNQDILSLMGSLYVLIIFFVFSVLFIIVIPTFLGIVGSTNTLMILGLTFTFIITNMAYLSAVFHWYIIGDLEIQSAMFCAIFFLSWILYNIVGRKSFYYIIIIYFITNSMAQLIAIDGAKPNSVSANNKLVELIGQRIPASTTSIYLLIYDAYVINETMLKYGIDNSPQEKYLESLGFKLYPHTYSIGAATVDTMSRVLNVSKEFYGNPRKGVSGDGTIINLLKSFGYETYGLFYNDYFFHGIGSSYDFSFPKALPSNSAHKLLTKAIFMGEFRFEFEFDQPSHEQFMEYKLGILKSDPSKPMFIYMHTDKPRHSQNSGVCLSNEIDLFRKRLFEANEEMKQDVETVIKKDPYSIIIVAGDHGPYLTKNCTKTGPYFGIAEISRLDIQDRYGTFLAIKWPDEEFFKYDDITIIQDLFPAIFAYLFKDEKLLEAKVSSMTLFGKTISGATVKNGIINGGINDGETLFLE